jgi:alpha-1,2-mannosyltransferase
MPAAGPRVASAGPDRVDRWARPGPVNTVIILATLLAIGLRLYQLTRPQYLLGVTEYDDGTDFGSAILLVHGYLPYRDFIIVQPPGITLLMAPVAVLTKGLGTAWGMGVARILTAVAGGAAVGLAGLLVRHRGLLAVILSCGILAVFPDSINAAHTVLLEPWLVLFCLLGAVAVFDRDRLASSRWRLIWGGVAFGVAGAIKVWAILPVLVILVLLMAARQPRRAAGYLAGVAAGFLVPVLPFAAMAPGSFYRSVVIAQLVRIDSVRIPLSYRLAQMGGLSDFTSPATVAVAIVTLALIILIVGSSLAAWRLTRERPPALELFALGTAGVTVIAFLWPADFYYHYAGFLAPFLALAVGLPVARLVDALGPGAAEAGGRPGPGRPRLAMTACAVAGVALLALTVIQAHYESTLRPPGSQTSSGPAGGAGMVAAARRIIPAGACVLTDQASYTIAANRFLSSRPGCVPIVDGVGSDYSLSHGLNALTGAGRVASVRALWLSALRGAQYVWLSPMSYKRIPWNTAEITQYFNRNFAPARGVFGLYVRGSSGATPPGRHTRRPGSG